MRSLPGWRSEAQALRRSASRLAPRDQPLLAQVRGQKQRFGTSGSQHLVSALHGLQLPTDRRRVPQVHEVGWARTRSQRALEKLAQQCAGTRSRVANLALQVFSCWRAPGVATTSTDLAYLPPLWQARH